MEDQMQQITQYAADLMQLAKDTVTVRFRFFDTALARLPLIQKPGMAGFATEGSGLYYDPVFLLQSYKQEPNLAVRGCIHMLLHCVFHHPFHSDKLNQALWKLATDLAVENIIFQLDLKQATLSRDEEERELLELWRKRMKRLTADRIYRELLTCPPEERELSEWNRLLSVDFHESWQVRIKRQTELSKEAWEKIARQLQMDLQTFSRGKTDSDALLTNLGETVKKHYDYRSILERFATIGEEISVSADEFDYIYYTYGLKQYGNLPLIEPLEYREVKKLREFVIAIDTSASCKGETVRAFLTRTYDILKQTESFFREIQIRILQCDNQIRHDRVIRNQAELRQFAEEYRISGFGSTDFRPVFEYVEHLKEKGAFQNLKGLIYFTDGYGIYPEKMPDYDVIFAFLQEDDTRMPVPGWATQVIMEEELDEYS
jgi:predicted metal-dependent peptidase